MYRIVVGILLSAFINATHAQVGVVDSLQNALAIYFYQDTVRINALTALARHSSVSNPTLTRQSVEEALVLSQKLNYPEGIADAFRELSRYYWNQMNYHKAIDYGLIAAEKYRALNFYDDESWCLGTVGICYAQGNKFRQSIDYLQKALHSSKQTRNKSNIARNLNNLGYVFEMKKDFRKALSYYQEALDIQKEMGYEADVVMSLSNVGSTYLVLGEYTLARSYFENAHLIAVKADNQPLKKLLTQKLATLEQRRNAQRKEHVSQRLKQGKGRQAFQNNMLYAALVVTSIFLAGVYTWLRYRSKKIYTHFASAF